MKLFKLFLAAFLTVASNFPVAAQQSVPFPFVQPSYDRIGPSFLDVTNIVLSIGGGGGGGATNGIQMLNGVGTNTTLYGDIYIKTYGTSAVSATAGNLILDELNGLYWGVNASIWYNSAHSGAPEMQLGSGGSFAFTEGLNQQQTAVIQIGGSGHYHGVPFLQYDEERITNGFPKGFSHYFGWGAKYWNTNTSAAQNHYGGMRYEMLDNTTTNAELVFYGKLRGWSQNVMQDEVINKRMGSINDDGTLNFSGANITNSASIGFNNGAQTIIGDNNTSPIYLKGTIFAGVQGSGVSFPEITVQSSTGAGNSFIEFGRKSTISGDATRFSFNDRTGAAIFRIERSGGGGYWNAGGITFGGTTIIAGTLDAAAMNFKYKANIVSKTANYTVLAGDSGNHFDNVSASGAITNTLPTAAVGLIYTFTVTDAQILAVKASGTDVVNILGVDGTAGGGVYSNLKGYTIVLVCHKAGIWTQESGLGTWATF